MNRDRTQALATTRRHFFRESGVGVGKIALASLLSDVASAGALASTTGTVNPPAPREPHFAPKAKRVIHLFMAGAPSQLDLFDSKPELARFEGKPLPPSIIGGQRYAFIRPDAAVETAARCACVWSTAAAETTAFAWTPASSAWRPLSVLWRSLTSERAFVKATPETAATRTSTAPAAAAIAFVD